MIKYLTAAVVSLVVFYGYMYAALIIEVEEVVEEHQEYVNRSQK